VIVARLPARLRIRGYEPSDQDGVWRLHRERVMQTTPQYPEALPGYEDDLVDIAHHYLGEGCGFWVVDGPDGLIGMTAIQRIDSETARLRRMRVTERWRRKGIARALLEEAEQFCRGIGYKRLILDTTEQQTAAHDLYERAGFVRVGERSLGPFLVFDYVKELL